MSAQPTALKPRPLILLLASVSMLGALSIDTYLPALPAIATAFAVSMPAVQQTLSAFLIGSAVMMLFHGTLSDSFGRRPVLLAAMAVYVVSSLGAAFAPNLAWLVFFRLIQGCSSGAGGVIGRAIIADLYTGPEAQQMLSFISMVFGLAPAIAPVLGGWLQAAFGWRAIFLFISFFSVMTLLVCVRLLPESLPREKRHAFHPKIILSTYWKVGGHFQFVCRCLASALSFAGTAMYIGLGPTFILDLLHLNVKSFAWLFIPLISGMTLGSWLAARCAHTMAPATMIRLGFIVMFGSSLANVVYDALFPIALPWAVLAPFLYSGGMTFVGSTMTLQILGMFPETRGMVSSLMSFVFMVHFSVICGVICPLLFGPVHATHSALPISCAIVGATALSLLCWRLGGGVTAPVTAPVLGMRHPGKGPLGSPNL